MTWVMVIMSLLCQITLSSSCSGTCICSFDTVDCSSRELVAIPNDLLPEFVDADTLGNPLSPSFASTIIRLNMANNQLKGLSTVIISESLPNLQSLDLSNNKIDDVANVQSVVLNKRLLHFKLSTNPIRHLGYNRDTVIYSESISHLDLSDCAIHSITNPLSLAYLLNLTHLNLSGNPLIVIDHLDSFSLSHLDLSRGLIGLNEKGIREETFINLPKLMFLNLSWNAHLTTIPIVKPLSLSLQYLDASYCAFEKVSLKCFPNLKRAILRGNLIKVLENNTLLGNPKLERFDVSKNAINHIEPLALIGGDTLKELDLSSNHLSNLNWKIFHHTPQLKILNISRNLIKFIDKISLYSLTNLDASKCEITKLYPRFLTEAPNLKYLNLSHNLIEKLPRRLTSSNLIFLDLSFCQIYDLEEESFHDLTSINELNLMGNRLTTPIQQNLLEYLPNIKELNLLNNPWHCDCDDPQFQHMWEYLSSSPIKTKYFNDLNCQSPKLHHGVSWNKSCFETFAFTEKNMYRKKAWFSFLVPFLTISFLLAVLMVIRQAYGSRNHEAQNESNQRANDYHTTQFVPRSAPHTFDDDLERGIQMSANESLQRSSIQALSKLPSYEEALLLPNPQNSEDLKSIVNKYEKTGRFSRSESTALSQQLEDDNSNEDAINSPSTSAQ